MDKPLAAIWCLVYNHEPFLKQCLDGFVMQQTNFRFVAIVHDDCSKDGSASIIREYATQYPDIIRPIYETENQYSKPDGRLNRIMQKALMESGAKYVALCEGDDYWTDPNKLQREVEFLEENPDYTAVAENGLVRYEDTKAEHPFNTDATHDLSMEEVISSRCFPTAGVVYRRETMDGLYDITNLLLDTVMWCWLITKGRFRYNQTISSVYRKNSQGMTVYTEPYAFAQTIERWNEDILRIFAVKKSFMYFHLAKIYKSFILPAFRQGHYRSGWKCLLRGGLFTTRGIVCSLFRIK